MQETPEPRSFLRAHATLFKMMGIGVLGLLLLIPMAMVGALLGERLARRDEAVAEITRTWGGRQQVIGPVLVVPIKPPPAAVVVPAPVVAPGTTPEPAVAAASPQPAPPPGPVAAYFLPATLNIDATVD